MKKLFTVFIILFFSSCGVRPDEKEGSEILTNYLNDIKAQNYRAASIFWSKYFYQNDEINKLNQIKFFQKIDSSFGSLQSYRIEKQSWRSTVGTGAGSYFFYIVSAKYTNSIVEFQIDMSRRDGDSRYRIDSHRVAFTNLDFISNKK